MKPETKLVIDAVLAHEPTIGSTDVSKCLPGWIDSFCKKHLSKEGWDLSPSGVNALCHTLIAAQIRAERLVRERDQALAELAQIKGSH